MARLSSAVCAINGVWLFENIVPFCSMKFRKCGIISKSDGTFGLSRKKCTLSNTMFTTCSMPPPRLHPGAGATFDAAALGGELVIAPIAVSALAVASRSAVCARRMRIRIDEPPDRGRVSRRDPTEDARRTREEAPSVQARVRENSHWRQL